MTIEIIGTGKCVPTEKVDNVFFEDKIDTSDEWISSRTGIHSRHLAVEETTSSMASSAAKAALEDAGADPMDVDLLLAATISPDYAFPSTACIIQGQIGAKRAVGMDISAACSGFVFALNTAYAYISAGIYNTALIVGVETLSRHIDWKDRSTCVLFGDGAGAVVVRRSERGLIDVEMGSDGEKGMVLNCRYAPVSNLLKERKRIPGTMEMDGQEVFRFAVKSVPKCVHNILEKNDYQPEDIKWYLLHQANVRIIQSISKKLQVDMERFPCNLDEYGNTSAASIPMLLDDMHKKKMLKSGDKLIFAGFGGGLTWGACLLEWTID